MTSVLAQDRNVDVHVAKQKDILVLLLISLRKKELRKISFSGIHRVWHIVLDLLRKQGLATEPLTWNNLKKRYDSLEKVISSVVSTSFSRELTTTGNTITLDFTSEEAASVAASLDENLGVAVESIASTINLHLRM